MTYSHVRIYNGKDHFKRRRHVLGSFMFYFHVYRTLMQISKNVASKMLSVSMR